MRTLIRAGVLGAGLSAALLCAPAAQAAPHGDNGTVKIHDAKTGEVPRRNEPHVCTFYLDAFGFDAVQQVDWHIEAWAPTAHTKGETVKSGAITLDGDGHGRTADMSLPDGHYKLFWNFDGEKGSAKHKVFWTDCSGSQGGGGGTPSGRPSGSAPAPSPSSSAPSSSSPVPSVSSSSPGAVPSVSPSAPGGGLAETGNGVPVGLVSGAAAVLVGAGGYLVARRRKAVRG
ncbi:LPXTG cell wall anchor domain-containing protein [Streptomyces sp. L2]|uniref:LPXTG cell wall anchor domain-containing protein n=1 Tax=Streptomyces sp. L2 TaxID=2162665 RepID=UPI0010139630|nr:LPXTG cell wall anchor domain-containing protein [Streptomyces sp. L2]